MVGMSEFRSSDPDEVRDALSTQFTKHDFSVEGRSAPVDTVMRAASLGEMSINFVQYGAPVEIEQTVPEDIFMIGRPLRGQLEVRNGEDVLAGGAPRGAILSMNRPNKIIGRTSDLQFRVVRMERAVLERHLAHCLGRELSTPLAFDFALPADGGAGQAWWSLVEHLWAGAESGTLFASPLLLHAEQQLVKTMLLTLQRHNYTDALGQSVAPAVPYYVRRAEEYIIAHADQTITIEDLVTISGVSARSLYEGFRRFRETTPMAFLKRRRLDMVRGVLLAADPASTTVTASAAAHGLCHLGNFAADYKRRFGETPSATLRSAG